jgi:hypothetical protein
MPAMNLSAYLTSLARTVVPTVWGALISWAVYAGILAPELQGQALAFSGVLVAVAISLYYLVVRFLETQAWWPSWLSAVLLGAPSVPVYVAQTTVDGGTGRPTGIR